MWRSVNLGKNIDVISGYAFSSSGFNDEENGLPLIRIRDIDAEETELYYSGQYQEAFVVNRGDVLVGMDGEFNIHKWKGSRALLNQRVLMLREKRTSDLDITFSYYWLSPFLKDVEHKTAATTVKHLTSKEVKNAEILAPRKSIQQKIGAILQTTDSAIEKTQALIAKYESIKQGMMQDLFTRGVDESGQLRPSYEDAPHLYHETELGWIPKDWAVERLDNLAEIDRGKFTHRPRNDPRMYGGEYPFIQTSDVTASNGGEIDTFNQTLSKAGTRVSKSFPRGTIAVTIAANIADTGFLGREMYFPDSVVGVQVSDPNNRHFVELCIRMNKQQLDALAPQSAQKNINLEDLRPMLVPRPSPDEQKAIADRYRAITSKIESEKIFLAKLHKTKLGLMQDLLTGKVRVAEDIDERKEAVA